MDINQYYIAVYSKCLLEEVEESNNNDDLITSILDNITFYEKKFYLAHIKEKTRYQHTPEDLSYLAKDDEFDETDYENITLEEGKWIEDICELKVIFFDDETCQEIDGIEYLENKGLFYYLAESGSIKFASWCEKEDI
jgi:hypothetical protein